jgi:hypothetical protein
MKVRSPSDGSEKIGTILQIDTGPPFLPMPFPRRGGANRSTDTTRTSPILRGFRVIRVAETVIMTALIGRLSISGTVSAIGPAGPLREKNPWPLQGSPHDPHR